MSFFDEVNKRRKYLQKILAEATKRLSKAPEGNVRINRKNTKIEYYHRSSDSPKPNGTYISKKNLSLAKALAQKEYDKEILRKATNEEHLLQELVLEWEKGSVETVYEKFNSLRQELIDPVYVPDNTFIEEWNNIKYDGKPFSEDSVCFYTNKGERVRSKSEVMIANALLKAGVPYHYEFPLVINGTTIYPDFKVLNMKKRTEMIWEHFGLLDDHDYREMMLSKIRNYILAGYCLGETLIITFETSRQPLDSRIIEATIWQHLLS